jgi:hypothetical protein
VGLADAPDVVSAEDDGVPSPIVLDVLLLSDGVVYVLAELAFSVKLELGLAVVPDVVPADDDLEDDPSAVVLDIEAVGVVGLSLVELAV